MARAGRQQGEQRDGAADQGEPAGAAGESRGGEGHEPAVTRRVQPGDEPRDVLHEKAQLQVEDILPDRLHESDGKRAEAQDQREEDEPLGGRRLAAVCRGGGRRWSQVRPGGERERKRKQGDGEPQRPARSEEASRRKVVCVKRRGRAEVMVPRIEREQDERMDHQHIGQGGQAEADEALAPEGARDAAGERAGGEIRREEEQQSHEERLQHPLPHNERHFRRKRRLGLGHHIPVAHVAVGHARVHIYDEHDHRRAQVIDPRQSRRRRGTHAGQAVPRALPDNAFSQ